MTGRAKPMLAEVGVWRGKCSKNLLRMMPHCYLYCVDPLTEPLEGYNQRAHHPKTQERWDHIFARLTENTEPFRNRCTLVRKFSVEASTLFEDKYFDCVFIDADHRYEPCLDDIKAWLPKVKSGGFIGGHDYDHPREQDGTWGVKRAVLEVFPESWVKVFPDYCWFVGC